MLSLVVLEGGNGGCLYGVGLGAMVLGGGGKPRILSARVVALESGALGLALGGGLAGQATGTGATSRPEAATP